MTHPISYDVQDHLGIITFNNPPLNLLSSELTDGLLAIMDEIESELPRALLLRSQGKAFCAGADVIRFSDMPLEAVKSELSSFFSLIHRVEKLPIPTVAMVHGFCAGGGLEIALSMDLIVATESAKFGQTEAIIGAIPFAGGLQRLAARCGPARAKEIYFNTGFYSSSDFERWNIINKIWNDDIFETEAFKEAHRLANGPTQAYAYSKNILACYSDNGIDAADSMTLEVGINTFETSDFQNGVASLLKEGPGKAVFEGK